MWYRSSSNPAFDYPHTNIPDATGKIVNLQLHALIMDKIVGKVIDHIDGDHYNASRSNLRHVTTAQNNQNRHKRTQLKSKYITSKFVTEYIPLVT